MIKVCIVITTYNLEKYIEEALTSVLKQKTTFTYKIIVADDCSTDGTIDILKDYKNKYPEKIQILLSEKNRGSLANSNRVFDGIQCEYFSFLDGDDYWVGEDRLQRQVEFLDKNPEYSMCAGNTQYLREKKGEFLLKQSQLNKEYTFQDFLSDRMPFFHTSSILVRNCIFKDGLPDCFKEAESTFENCALRGEDFRRILHLERGKLFAFDELFSVYRIHEKGIWQGSSQKKRMLEGTIGYNFYSKYFGNKYGDYFQKKAKDSYQELMNTLVVDYGLVNSYRLNKEETVLFTSLLQDLARDNNEDNINWRKPNKNSFVKKINRKIIKKIMKNM